MMGELDFLPWQQTCCEWHGHYAEADLPGGGRTRIKRAADGELLVSRFDAANRALDVQGGEPCYVSMSESDVLALLGR